MRKHTLALIFSMLSFSSAVAETSDTEAVCKAPVSRSIYDKACADMLAANAGTDRQGMEQRDDGYYVFVPRTRAGD